MGDAAKKSGDNSPSAAIGLCDQDNHIELINFIPDSCQAKMCRAMYCQDSCFSLKNPNKPRKSRNEDQLKGI